MPPGNRRKRRAAEMIVSYDTIMPRLPLRITGALLELTAEIARSLGRLEGLGGTPPRPKLRKTMRVRSVRGSLAIEGNSLSEEQVTHLLDGTRIVGPKREILEVRNALRAYDAAAPLSWKRERDLLAAHALFMKGLAPDAGRYRAGNVGVVHGHGRVAHVAPPAARVPLLMRDLFAFARSDEIPLLVRAAVVHYEIEFIHPFSDGNGRLGRFWQHAMLRDVHAMFDHVPTESLILERQAEYYRVLGACDRAGDSTAFVEFILRAARDALAELAAAYRPMPESATDRLERARAAFGDQTFTRADYLGLLPKLSTATASRDLRHGVVARILARTGTKALARYGFRTKRPTEP